MTADTISLLVCYDTLPSVAVVDNFYDESQEDDLVLTEETIRYLNAYKNLRYGWEFAHRNGRQKRPIPEILTIGEEWVFRACLHLRNPERYRDRAIQGAAVLASHNMKETREVLHALLVCEDAGPKEAAKYLNLDPETVQAYEQLFFNITDRKTDAAFIRSVVYPQTRLVELMQNYMKHEPLGNLLLRAGYNNGVEDVLHFAGFKSSMLKKTATQADVPSRLEAAFMAHGYLLVRNGFINQNVPAVRDARSLIAAAKQGGEGQKQSSPWHGEVGRNLYSELLSTKRNEAETMLRQVHQ